MVSRDVVFIEEKSISQISAIYENESRTILRFNYDIARIIRRATTIINDALIIASTQNQIQIQRNQSREMIDSQILLQESTTNESPMNQ